MYICDDHQSRFAKDKRILNLVVPIYICCYYIKIVNCTQTIWL